MMDVARAAHSNSQAAQPEYQFLKVEKHPHGVRRVTISRPELHNAFNERLIAELTEVFSATDNVDEDVRCIVLTGEGKSFSAGADLDWMKRMAEYDREANLADASALYRMFASIRRNPLPVIGRINGSAMGGGVGLISVCDFAFGLSSSKFGLTEVRLGLIPAVISPFVMEKISSTHASRYFLTGERFDATEAVRIGLLQECVSSEDQLDERVNAAAFQITQCSPTAVKSCKQLIHTVQRVRTETDEAIGERVADAIATVRASPQGKEGVRSFLEKRKPAWLL